MRPATSHPLILVLSVWHLHGDATVLGISTSHYRGAPTPRRVAPKRPPTSTPGAPQFESPGRRRDPNMRKSGAGDSRAETVLVSADQVRVLNERISSWVPVLGQWTLFGGITLGGAGGILALGSAGVMSSAGAVSLAKLYAGSVAGSTGWTLLAHRFLGGGHRICKQMKGQQVPPDSGNRLMRDVRDTASAAGLPYTPAVYVIPSREPNAFAAGHNAQNSVVAVTSGLLEALSPQEVKAVVAHEMGHARHSDVGRMMQTAAMVAGFSATARLGWDMLTNPRRKSNDDDDDDAWVAGAVLTGVGATTYAAGTLLRLASSRSAEYRADAFARQIGLGAPLASALEKIEQASRTIKRDALGGSAEVYAHMYISNEPNHDMWASLAGWLATHPPTHSRIGKLRGDVSPNDGLQAPLRPKLSGWWSALRDEMEDPQ